jgi:hypothetical protein
MSETKRRAYPLFNIGDRVQVRAGVSHPGRPDLLIEGWTGLVAEVSDEQPVSYRVSLDDERPAAATAGSGSDCDVRIVNDCEIVLPEESLEPENLDPLHFT